MKALPDLMKIIMAATEDGRIKWESHTVGFEAKINDVYKIETWAWTDPDSVDEGLSVALKRNGKLIDRNISSNFDADHPFFEKFFNCAMRSANDINSVIDEVEAAIENLPRKH